MDYVDGQYVLDNVVFEILVSQYPDVLVLDKLELELFASFKLCFSKDVFL